jgi:hypothetical protein
MLRLLLLLALFVSGIPLHAQDTIRVQTLTWADQARSGYFQFPAVPGQTYEKILMRYNMRCHNAAVGSGNVGCREWDYSCNTFLTDPTLLDSTLSKHPSHRISGFTGITFPYTDQPYYNYTQYEQTATTFADTTSWSVAEVGTDDIPLYLGALAGRSREQYLYPAADLLAAGLVPGPISALQLNVLAAGGTVPFLKLALQQVDLTVLDPLQPITDGFTEVYFRTTTFATTGWTSLPFRAPFTWDGTSSLLLDVSQTGSPATPLVQFAGTQTPANSGAAPAIEARHYLGLQGTGNLAIPAAALGMNQAVTIAFWAYGLPAALPTNTSVMEARDGANRRQINIHLPWSDGVIYWDCGNDGSGYDRISKAASPDDFEGRWTHWAFTKDATTGRMEIYLNGELWHSETGKNRAIAATRMLVGSDADGNWPWPGNLDHLSLWQTALTAADIQQLMYQREVPTNHPAYAALLADYPLNEGTGLLATDVANNFDAELFGPNWQTYRGEDLRDDWFAIPYHYSARWEQGVHTIVNTTELAVDSTLVNPSSVNTYAVDASNNLVLASTYQTYPATASYRYDEAGNVLETYPLAAQGTISIADLTYHRKRPAKFELLSLVTPYGNGLDLGQAGKTFTFDVTDFAPILTGERFLSMELGGENQEQMDISFLFITGTPTRDVLAVENVWPFARGGYDAIQANTIFEPRTLRLRPDADAIKLRSSITGHGQNGEFVPRQHYLNLNGGSQDFAFNVWKDCGENPIYPQGGTWIFDRAGWCPGMATDLHEFFLPDNLGNSLEIDYGVNGASLTEANYLVSTQLVSYGPPNFTLDAALVDIIRPSKRVEHERFNPACNQPLVVVKNNGLTPLTSLDISYGVAGGSSAVYTWTGNLALGETATVALPVDDYLFWQSNAAEPEFVVTLAAPNAGADEYQPNNTMRSPFTPAIVFDFENLLLQVRTNNRPAENRYTIKDAAGAVVLARNNMAAATTYRDDIALPPGCYSLEFEDDGGDGLDFWYWAAVGQNVGTGTLSFRRQFNQTVVLGVRTLNPDFGGNLHYDFIIPQAVGTEDVLTEPRRFSVYPNPAATQTTIELTGFTGETANWEIRDMTGRAVQHGRTAALGELHTEQLDVSSLPAGMYLVQVLLGQKVYTQEIVVLPK